MKNSNKTLKVFEGFAGYGGASFALKRYKKNNKTFEYDVVGYSEIDKYASELFDFNHTRANGDSIVNFGNISNIKTEDIPSFDLFTGGFPCQPFSTAGMQKGIDDPYGRGSLFLDIIRLCSVAKPKYILMENVKGILSKKFQETLSEMNNLLRELGYVANKEDINELPLKMAVLNTKNYGIPQNRERVWMFARLGGLPSDFSMIPEEQKNELRIHDFLDPKNEIEAKMYLSKDQINHLKFKHNIESFIVDKSLCFDVYNKKIKTDGYSITITLPEHNSLRIIEANGDDEIVRKMTIAEQFRLMGLESLTSIKKDVDIKFPEQSYTQLSKRAGNGWDVNVVSILLEHIFKQLKEIDGDEFNF